MNNETLLKKFIELVLERRIREVDVASGEKKVQVGSDEHIADLKVRIKDLTRWRDASRKGTQQRANYARIISRLRGELRSAIKKNTQQIEEAESEVTSYLDSLSSPGDKK